MVAKNTVATVLYAHIYVILCLYLICDLPSRLEASISTTVLESCTNKSREAFGIAVMATLFKTSKDDDETKYSKNRTAVLLDAFIAHRFTRSHAFLSRAGDCFRQGQGVARAWRSYHFLVL